MGAGSIVLNQPGVYLVDADGNVITLVDGAAIGSAEALLIAGKDGSNARIIRVESDGTVRIDPTGATTQPISASSLPLPTGASTSALQTQPGVDIGDVTVNNGAGAGAVNVQDGGNSITVDGPLTDAELRAFAVPISAASLPLPAGAATAALQTQPGVDIGDVTINNAAGAAAVPIQDGGNSITIDASSLPLPTGAATEATVATLLLNSTFNSRINTLGQKVMASSTPVVISSDQSEVASKNAVGTQVDGHSASIGTTTDPDTALTIIGRLKQIITKLAGGLPASLIGGRLDQNLGSWLGSTAPTVGQKPMATSVPVTLATDQTALEVTFAAPAGGTLGISTGTIQLGGSSAGTLNAVRATVYTEQTADAQRSLKSNNASDTSAGVGARTVEITFFDATGAGPFVEVVTLNGTTAVNMVATNICFIEKMVVKTVGSTLRNVGTLTLNASTGGAGAVIGTIGVGNLAAGQGDNRTLWAHHYIPPGKTASLATYIVSAESGGSGTNAMFSLRSAPIPVGANAEIVISDLLLVIGPLVRVLTYPLKVVGPARVIAYGIPGGNNVKLNASFDFSEAST